MIFTPHDESNKLKLEFTEPTITLKLTKDAWIEDLLYVAIIISVVYFIAFTLFFALYLWP